MSSWLVSLGCAGRSVAGRRRYLQKDVLGMPGIAQNFCGVWPWRLVAEARAQIVEQRSNLVVGHAVGKAWHDRAALAFPGVDAHEYDVGCVACIRTADGAASR